MTHLLYLPSRAPVILAKSTSSSRHRAVLTLITRRGLAGPPSDEKNKPQRQTSFIKNLNAIPKVPIYGEDENAWNRYVQNLKDLHPGLTARIEKNKLEGLSLSFAWITPKSLHRGLEGGIIARLLSTPELNLVGTRMYAPSNEFVDEYVRAHTETHPNGAFKPFVNFLNSDLRPHSGDKKRTYPNHLLLLLFTGENARQRIVDVVGSQRSDETHMTASAKTIRGSYGDLRQDPVTGEITEFQPAIVPAHSDEANVRYLRVFSKYAFTDGGILDIEDPNGRFSNGMVMIKPDCLASPSAKPGHIMDLFSSTGLTLIGSSVFSMSIAQARDFYGHLEPIFERKMVKDVERVLKTRLEGAFDFKVPDEVYTVTTALLMKKHAQREVSRIVSFMTGREIPPDVSYTSLPASEQLRRGPARCLALLYRGPNAIDTIRSKLGSTDPHKALPGTVRFDYGFDVMKNSAHASDSPEALEREMKIIRFGQGGKASIKKIIDIWFSE